MDINRKSDPVVRRRAQAGVCAQDFWTRLGFVPDARQREVLESGPVGILN